MDAIRKVDAECLATRIVLHRLIVALAAHPGSRDMITSIQASSLASIIEANSKIGNRPDMREYGDAILRAASDLFSPIP